MVLLPSSTLPWTIAVPAAGAFGRSRSLVMANRGIFLPLRHGVGVPDRFRSPERVQVGFLRQHELEERLLLEAARLGDRQQQEVLWGHPFEEGSRDLPLYGQLPDRPLCHVV